MTNYYIVKNGKPAGPFTLEEIRLMDLRGTDFVKEVGWEDYKELREIAALSELLGVSYERTLPQYYATLDVRLLAAAIDYFFALIIYCLFAFAILLKASDQEEKIALLLYGTLLIPLFKMLLNVFGEGSVKGASPGKLLLQIRVTDSRGNPIGFWRALWRNVAKLSGILTLGLGFLAGFFDRKQRCLHDRLSGTMVIKTRLL